MGCCRVKGVAITLAVLGIVLLVFGLVAKPALDAIMAGIIKKDVVLDSPKSQFYEIWQNSSQVPIFMTFYLFNVSNPDGVKHHGEKPKIYPVGPFNYNELRVKHDIEWSSDRTTVRYMYNRTFHALKKRCPPGVLYPDFECTIPDDIPITTGNIPLMGLANEVGVWRGAQCVRLRRFSFCARVRRPLAYPSVAPVRNPSFPFAAAFLICFGDFFFGRAHRVPCRVPCNLVSCLCGPLLWPHSFGCLSLSTFPPTYQIENLPLNNTKVKESLLALVQDFVISKFPSGMRAFV